VSNLTDCTAVCCHHSTYCSRCGVVAASHGWREVTLIDAPSFDGPVCMIWRKRTWRCGEAACGVGSFTEQNENVAKRRALLTRRACWWAIGQIRREHASVAGVCVNWARRGTRSGRRLSRYSCKWMRIQPGSMELPRSALTSTPGTAPANSATHTTSQTLPRGARSPSVSSNRSLPARSPRSVGSGRLSTGGRLRSCRTGARSDPTTAAPKR
jgi:hypothetical protein